MLLSDTKSYLDSDDHKQRSFQSDISKTFPKWNSFTEKSTEKFWSR